MYLSPLSLQFQFMNLVTLLLLLGEFFKIHSFVKLLPFSCEPNWVPFEALLLDYEILRLLLIERQ
jgi:hypothetical protein